MLTRLHPYDGTAWERELPSFIALVAAIFAVNWGRLKPLGFGNREPAPQRRKRMIEMKAECSEKGLLHSRLSNDDSGWAPGSK
jgi:hypothetical protein